MALIYAGIFSESASGLKRLRNDPQANTIACLIEVRGGGWGWVMKYFLPLLLTVCMPLMGDDAAKKKFEETKANAEKGDASAQFSLGIMYFKGHGVSQDHKEAVKWYRKSAEQGDAGAQYALGYLYYNGKGVKENRITAYAVHNCFC